MYGFSWLSMIKMSLCWIVTSFKLPNVMCISFAWRHKHIHIKRSPKFSTEKGTKHARDQTTHFLSVTFNAEVVHFLILPESRPIDAFVGAGRARQQRRGFSCIPTHCDARHLVEGAGRCGGHPYPYR
jgi:hypothetical protein